MVRVYAVILAAGVVLLVGWIFAAYLAGNVPSWKRSDPEDRFGIPGRRVVAGLVGFGLAGMSAEFSPFGLSWPIALALAIAGAGVMVWYAGSVDRLGTERRPVAGHGNDQR